MFAKDIGIDLVPAYLLAREGRGCCGLRGGLRDKGTLLKVGTEAQRDAGPYPLAHRGHPPLRRASSPTFDMTERMLRSLSERPPPSAPLPRVVICVPSGTRGGGARRMDAGIQVEPGGLFSLSSLWPPPSARASISPNPTAT